MTDGLAPHVRLVRLRAEAALLRRLNAGYGFADSRVASQMYLRDSQARERLGRDALRPQDTHVAQAAEVAAGIEAAEAALADHDSRLSMLARRFRLTAAERALVSIACAYELDADVRDLCHALAGRRGPALCADVCQELAPALAEPGALIAALHPAGPLRRAAILEVAGGAAGAARAASPIGLGRAVLDWLLGDDRVAEPLDEAVELLPAGADLEVHLDATTAGRIDDVAGRIAAAPAADRVPAVLVQGPPGSGKRAIAHRLAAALDRPLAVISLAAVEAAGARSGEALVRRALAEATLRDAVPYIPDVETLYTGTEGKAVDPSAAAALTEHPGPVVLGTRARGMPTLPIARPFYLVRAPGSDLDNRRRAWERGLATLGSEAKNLPEGAAALLAGRYVVGPATVSEVVRDARGFARATGAPVSLDAVEEAVARRLTLRLGAFGTVITRRARFDEMVLPEDVIEALRDMIAMVRERSRILEGWGYARHLGLSRGVSALFSGEPGTGKTMAASVISSELGLEMIRIDLSAVISKWVGETEKHLARIFDEAQSANAMLLFDEADSLFGKRTDLKSAQDRYANLEVNYILQRMESFDGVSVLTTNFENAIDKAFIRRLNFRIRFPEPEVDEREQLWRALLPPETEIAGDIDFSLLARRFEMTGGHIRNAIVRAAVIAAREGRLMQPEDLLAGAHHEYVELGKVMPSL